MPSLMAIIGGDMTQLKQVLDSASDYARSTGVKIKNSMVVSMGSQGGAALKDSISKSLAGWSKPLIDMDMHGKSGVMRETMVLMHEMANGNWRRFPSSMSILLGQLGWLPKLLSPIVLVPVAAAAAFVGLIYLTKKWGESLLTLKWPEANPEHIAKNLQKVNQAAQAQKEVNLEIEKSINLYTSAAEAAKRLADTTEEYFDHLRKMNQYAEEKELAHAKSEDERKAIHKRHSDEELRLNAEERGALIKQKQDEEKALKAESDAKLKQAEAIKVSSKQADEELLRQKRKAADEARDYLKKTDEEMQKEREEKGSVAGPTIDLPTKRESDRARDENRAEARRRIEDANKYADTVEENDEKRKRKEQFVKDAAAAAGKMVEAGGEAQRLAEAKARKDKDEAEEAKAKLAAQDIKRMGTIRPDTNALQKIGGAYASIYDTTMLDISKRSEQHLKEIKTVLANGKSLRGTREVAY